MNKYSRINKCSLNSVSVAKFGGLTWHLFPTSAHRFLVCYSMNIPVIVLAVFMRRFRTLTYSRSCSSSSSRLK